MPHLAALDGMDPVFLPTWMVQRDIDAERSSIVPPDALKLRSTLHAVFPSRKLLLAKVRGCVDFIASVAPLA